VLIGGILFLLLLLLVVHSARGLSVAREVEAPQRGFDPLMPADHGIGQEHVPPPPLVEDDGGWPDIR
jgi:hypothetical protein